MSSNLDWMADASCRDHPNPDDFFPSSSGPAAQLQAAKAARICATCPVQRQCGEHRGNTGATSGVWGGSYHKTKTQQLAPINHGTDSGYHQHVKRRIPPCHSCRCAHMFANRKHPRR